MNTRRRAAGRIPASIMVVALAILLAGCIASPSTDTRTNTSTDSHDTTSATTQEATQEQDSNRPLCIGLLNWGSCNVTQSNVQYGAPQLDAPSLPVAQENSGLEPGTIILLGAGILFAFLWLAFVFIVNFVPNN